MRLRFLVSLFSVLLYLFSSLMFFLSEFWQFPQSRDSPYKVKLRFWFIMLVLAITAFLFCTSFSFWFFFSLTFQLVLEPILIEKYWWRVVFVLFSGVKRIPDFSVSTIHREMQLLGLVCFHLPPMTFAFTMKTQIEWLVCDITSEMPSPFSSWSQQVLNANMIGN